MPRTKKWSISDSGNRANGENRKSKPKKSKWSVCDSGKKWSIDKKRD